MAENKLYYPAKLASNNPDTYGIVDADEVSGFRAVTSLDRLYVIPSAILSILKDGSDAVGQYWYVISENAYYQLVDWNNRNTEKGWVKSEPKVMSEASNEVDLNAEKVQLYGGTESTKKKINPITTTTSVYDQNKKLLDDILKDYDYRINQNTQAVLTDGILQGIATPDTQPVTVEGQKISYVATQAGVYTNFKDSDNNALTLDRFQFAVLFYNGSYWEKSVLDIEQDRVFDGGRADTMYGGARTINCGNANNQA